MQDHPDQHPVQANRRRGDGKISTKVTLRAYEVYRRVFGEQKAMIEGECRGGFSSGELIAFLYAHSFPEQEWSRRVDEAFNGMENLSATTLTKPTVKP